MICAMEIEKKKFISEARYLKSFKESFIKSLTYEMDEIWLYPDTEYINNYDRITIFFKTFGYLDLIKNLNYELLVISYL